MPGRRPLRATMQRQVILDELCKLRTHPTADELYEVVRKRLPRISLGTVYRNLEVLSEAGIIVKIEMAGRQKRFDGMTENHYHIRCIECDRVDDLPAMPVPGIEQMFREVSDYEILQHRLEIIGICPECRKRPRRGGLRHDDPGQSA